MLKSNHHDWIHMTKPLQSASCYHICYAFNTKLNFEFCTSRSTLQVNTHRKCTRPSLIQFSPNSTSSTFIAKVSFAYPHFEYRPCIPFLLLLEKLPLKSALELLRPTLLAQLLVRLSAIERSTLD